MRPIATEQDLLRNPLNDLLGAEAHVRLLRVLSEVRGSLSVADVADRARLTPPGARKALRRLVDTGFVVRVGAGRDQQFALRRKDPLTTSIAALFRAEQSRYHELLRAIRSAFEESSSPPHSAWISYAPRRIGEPLEISVLHEASSLRESLWEMRQSISKVETKFDLTIELVGYTKADLPDFDDQDLPLIAGVPLTTSRGERFTHGIRSHRDLDRRSRRLARSLAELVDRDPSLVERARRHLDSAIRVGHGAADSDLRDWRQILKDYSFTRLLRFLTSDSSRASRLRQSSPFYVVLTPAEREKLLDLVEAGP